MTGLNCVYKDRGLAGMLEAVNVKTGRNITVHWAFIDRICGECETCPIKTVLTKFKDVMHQVCGHCGHEI